MSATIAVVGATGLLGRPVAERLCQDGFAVRALSRNPSGAANESPEGMKWIQGDVEDEESLDRALEGCTGVHINLSGGADWDFERRGAEGVAAAAARAELQRITLISGCTVFEDNAWHPMIAAKLGAERAVKDSGVPYTIFKPTWFMDSLPRFVRGNKAMVMGKLPSPVHWVAAGDYARMVARAYAEEKAANQELFIHGPEAASMREAVEQYAAALAPQAKVSQMPLWILSLAAWVMRAAPLKAVVSMMSYFEKVAEAGDPTAANELLGAPETTLEQWCRKQQP